MNRFFSKHYNSLILLCMLAFLVVYRSVLLDLYHKWYAQGLTGPYAHGLLVAAIVVYMAASKIIELRPSLIPSPALPGLFLLVGSQLTMLLARLTDVNFVQHLAIISTMVCMIWAAYSFRIAKHFMILAVLFLFTLPVWSWIEHPLQIISIYSTNAILALTGIPYYLQGSYFHFSSGIIQIAPECAGMQQMLVSMVIGLLFSMQFNLQFRDIVKTLFYLATAAIVINTIRIIIIMIVGYYTRMESSLISKHLLLGWIIYGVAIFVFLYFYSGRNFQSVSSSADAGLVRDEKAASQPGLVILFLMFVVVFPAISSHTLVHIVNRSMIIPIQLHQKNAHWRKQSSQIAINWHPDYPRGDSRYTASYRNGEHEVYVFINSYQHVHKGIEPVNMDNSAYNRNKWRLLKHALGKIQNKNGVAGSVSLDMVDAATSQPLLIMSFYLINGKPAVKLVKLKLYTMLGLLTGCYDIKHVSLATPIQSGEGYRAGFARLENYWETTQLD